MPDYYNVTTTTGDAEIAKAIANNIKLAVTHIAFGDGNGSVPTPSKTRTTLIREVHRQPVNKYELHPTIANWIVIEAIIPSNIGGFTVREIGVIANNKLISHGSHAPFEKVADHSGVSEYRIKFTQDIRDGKAVSIMLDQSLIYASQAWVEENYIKRSEIIDNLTSSSADKPLSAKQGKALQDEKLDRKLNPAINDANIPGTSPGEISFDFVWGDKTKNMPDRAGIYGAYMQTARWPTSIFNAQMIQGMGDNPFIAYRGNNGGIYTTWRYVAFEDGNVASATKLQTARTVGFSGAATGSFNYDGSANSSCVLTLANSGVVAGTYGNNATVPVVTVDAKGLFKVVETQAIRTATTAQTGIVQLADALNDASVAKALSAKQGKVLQDGKLGKTEMAATSKNLTTDLTAFPSDESFILSYRGVGAAFFDNGSGKFFDQYSAGLISQIYDGGFFAIASDVVGGGIKTMSGTQSSDGTFKYLHKKNLATIDGNVASATKLQTARKITLSGAISGSADFDGSSNITINTNITDFDPMLYMLIPWPKTVPPSGYMVVMGQALLQDKHPILYSLYGQRLIDPRGQVLRGWDNGRGIDVGRSILSEQGDAIRNIVGTIENALLDNAVPSNNLFSVADNVVFGKGSSGAQKKDFTFDASRVVPTASENRVKNIAINYIIKIG